ncbi:hypothetical protein SGPA1_40356 [Streptomyces misionensis JCM 4497]
MAMRRQPRRPAYTLVGGLCGETPAGRTWIGTGVAGQTDVRLADVPPFGRGPGAQGGTGAGGGAIDDGDG